MASHCTKDLTQRPTDSGLLAITLTSTPSTVCVLSPAQPLWSIDVLEITQQASFLESLQLLGPLFPQTLRRLAFSLPSDPFLCKITSSGRSFLTALSNKALPHCVLSFLAFISTPPPHRNTHLFIHLFVYLSPR